MDFAVNFRMAKDEDMDFIFDSLYKAVEEEGYGKYFSCTKEELKKIIFQDKLAEVLLALKDNTPIGAALFSVTNCDFTIFKEPGLYLHEIYVAPDYRRHKVATHMRDKLKDIAKDKGLGRIEFIALKSNTPAMELYDSWKDAAEVKEFKYMRIML